MSQREVEILKRTLARERLARKQAEDILEKKSRDLFELNQLNQKSKEKLEALIKVKNSELKGFFENIVDPYIMMDLSGNVIKMNQASEKLIGYKVSDGLLNLMKLSLPKDFDHIVDSFKILHNTGRITNFKINLITKSNSVKLVDINASIIYDENNEAIAAQGILRDITQQDAAKQELLESENRLSTLILNLDSSVLLENEHNEVVLTNHNFCKLFSLKQTPQALKGEKNVGVLGISNSLIQNKKAFIANTQKIIAEEKTVMDEEILLKDGRTLRRNYNPIFIRKKYKGHLWTYKDITLRKNYQKSLEAEKHKYSSIITNMNLGLLEVDVNDNIMFANQSFLEMCGYQTEDLLGKVAMDLFMKGEDKEKLLTESKERREGASNSYEVKIYTKSQELRYWLISGAPNYNLQGEIIGSIGIHLDITNLKKLENQKEELLNELAKSNESLQEYAHVVSHDLKSPLRSIDALISWIKEDNESILNETSLENISLVEKTLEKMENLISDVLAYSSIGANLNLSSKVDLHALVQELVQVMYVPDNIKISFEQTLPAVLGDQIKLQQLFQNLLSNAIKFCDKEQGLIKISYQDMGTHYQFAISDNGIGIEAQYHDKIFKIFHSLQKRKDSSGIGLSIVKKITELHNGTIWLQSKVGEGTTFYFTLKK